MSKFFGKYKKSIAFALIGVMMGSAIAGPFNAPVNIYGEDAVEAAEDEIILPADLDETVIDIDDEEAAELFVEQSIELYGEEAVEEAVGVNIITDDEAENESVNENSDSTNEPESEDVNEVVVQEYASSVLPSEITDEQNAEIVETLYDASAMSTDTTYRKYTTTYLYDKMSDKQRSYYDKLYSLSLSYLVEQTNISTGGKDSEGKWHYLVQVPFSEFGLTKDDAFKVARIFLFTNPQFFYYNSGYSISSSYIGFVVNSNFTSGSARASARDSIYSKLTAAITAIGNISNQTERARAIHDWLYSNLQYAGNAYDQGVYSTFILHQTVCAGYAEGFAMMANALGLPTLSVTSTAHEWNEVLIDGKWYIVDATWDDDTNTGKYDFFKKSENAVFTYSSYSKSMHTLEAFWSLVAVPDCTPKYVSPTPKTTPTPTVTTKPMYRLYNPNSGEHFYTASASERSNLVSVGWRYEGVGWNAPNTGTPVYRMYNPNAGDHHYTTSVAEKNNLVRVGWRYEGIGWYSGGSKGLLRLYNPNAVSGSHHYTTSTAEKNNLVRVGWRYEGIGWYGY